LEAGLEEVLDVVIDDDDGELQADALRVGEVGKMGEQGKLKMGE